VNNVRLKIKLSKKWIIICILIMLILAYIVLDSTIRPTIISLAEAKLQAIAVKAMNDAVRATIGTSNLHTPILYISTKTTRATYRLSPQILY